MMEMPAQSHSESLTKRKHTHRNQVRSTAVVMLY